MFLVALAVLLLLSAAATQALPVPRAGRIVLAGTLCALASAALATAGLAHAAGLLDPDPYARVPFGLPGFGAHLRLDPLAAIGLMVVGAGGVAASIHAIGYETAHDAAHAGPAVPPMPFLALFLLGMGIVPLAADAFTLLLAFEAMSVASWVLVLAGTRDAASREAGLIYLLTAGFGTLCLVVALALLAGPDGAWTFAAIRETDAGPGRTSAAVVLAILGAGSKAGLFPLHVWLPLAHPAAPSPVSALMSGVMTKVALLVLVRILFDLAGPPDWWWGTALMALGLASALMGVLHALMERDLKRLLAYSTVENVGLIVLGLGVALQFQAAAIPTVAALAMTAALLHLVNHSLFKTLLFLAAGSVLTATGHRDLDRLGGLLRAMPATGAMALVGSLAIAGLPPLNGFASEWLTFQAVLSAGRLPQWELKMATAGAAAGLALVAALSVACFVRAFGIAFLGRPRSAEAATAVETNRPMRAGMAVPAVLCVLFGLFPMLPVALVAPAVLEHLPGVAASDVPATLLRLAPAGRAEGYVPWALAAVGGILGLAVWSGLRPEGGRRLRRAPAWGCGHPAVGPTAQYGATSLAQPLRRVFATTVFAARETVDMPAPGDTRPARFAVRMVDPAWTAIVSPILRAVGWLADRLDRLQFLTIRAYLSLTFGVLVLLLVTTAVLR